MELIDIPFVTEIAEWIWGIEGDDATKCLSEVPFLGASCFSQLLTKALGVGIIVGSMLNKVPIMVNMINSRTAAGISRNSLYGELMVYTNVAMYSHLLGHPITAYGENVSLLIQNTVLIVMTWNFLSKTDNPVHLQEKIMTSIGFVLYCIGILNFLPDEYLYLLMSSTWPVMLYARGSQVYATFTVKHTGNLSIVTTSMSLVGASIRILTTLKETGDMVVLCGYILSGSLSLIMFIQYWAYLQRTTELANNKKITTEEEKDESKKEK